MVVRQAVRQGRGAGRARPTSGARPERPATPDGHGANERSRGAPEPAARRVSPLHVHWFRRRGDDPYSGAGLYACRCGVVRPGF
jgi:ribosomal protein L15E